MSEQQKVKNYRNPSVKTSRTKKYRESTEGSFTPQYDATSWQSWSAKGNSEELSSEEVVSSIIKSQADKPIETSASRKESIKIPAGSLKISHSSDQGNRNIKLFGTQAGRLLCVSNIRGHFSLLNQLIKRYDAVAVLHCGEFGFYDTESCTRLSESTLRDMILSSPLLSKEKKVELNALPIECLRKQSACYELSQFSAALSGAFKFDAPIFTICGTNDDPAILSKLLEGKTAIPQLHILHCGSSGLIEIGGNRIRLLGISGDYLPQRLFLPEDHLNNTHINLVRMGRIIETAQKAYDPSEVRILMTTASPTKYSVMAQLAHTLNADYTISSDETAQYCLSYMETSNLSDPQAYQEKLIKTRSSLLELWEKIRGNIETDFSAQQIQWLKRGLSALNDLPEAKSLLERFWTFGLPGLTKGSLVMDISDGFISVETRSTGISFGHRLKNALKLESQENLAIANCVTDGIGKETKFDTSKPAENDTNGIQPDEAPIHPQAGPNGNAAKQVSEEQKCTSSWDDAVAEDMGQMNWDEPVFDGPMNWDEDLPENITKGHMVDWCEEAYEENGGWIDSNVQNDSALSTSAFTGLNENEAAQGTKLGMGAGASIWADPDMTKASAVLPTEPYTLWVGGFNKIPYTEEDVKSIFGSLRNSISQVKLVHDRHTGQQRAFCFVNFRDAESMERGQRRDGCEWNNGILRINRAEHREQTFNRPRVLANPPRRTGLDSHHDEADLSRISTFRGRGRSRGRGRGRNFSFD